MSLPEGPLAVVSVHSGHVLQGTAKAGDKTTVAQAADRGERHQRWRLAFATQDDQGNDYHTIENLHSGLVLEVACESADDGAPVGQGAYPQQRQTPHMQWRLIPAEHREGEFYQIVNRNSRKALDVEGGETQESTKEGARIIQWAYWAGSNQRWRLIASLPGDCIDSSSRSAPGVAPGSRPQPQVDIARALRVMRTVQGWFSEDEARLLLAVTSRALRQLPDDAVVEIGSYLGRSTVLLASAIRDLRPGGQIIAIDPHAGEVSTSGDSIWRGRSTYDAFCANVTAAGLRDAVRAIRQCSTEVSWSQSIGLLFIDGLHDYHNVSADFEHFQQYIVPGGFVAFHDYAPYWPGVTQFVDQLRHHDGYTWVASADSLAVLQKRS